jgi:hypothetical protein
VPHNLISVQESPVPLLKFQMAPRLKILIASGSKNEPRYTLLVSQKSRQMNPLQVPQQGPYGEGGLLTGHFAYISNPHLLGSPVKEPSLKVPLMESLTERCPTTRALFHSSIKVLGIQAAPPPKRDSHIWRLSQHIFQGPQWRSYPPGSLHGTSSERERERHFIHRDPFIHLSKSMVDEPSCRFAKQGPYGRRCPSPEPFLHILQGPQQGSPPSKFP